MPPKTCRRSRPPRQPPLFFNNYYTKSRFNQQSVLQKLLDIGRYIL